MKKCSELFIPFNWATHIKTSLLVALMSLYALAPAYAIDYLNWMQALDDNLFLSRLSIPGAHDAATSNCSSSGVTGSAHTQTFTIDQQLERGVRMFDLRPAWDGKDMMIYHGIVSTGVKFEDALNTLCDFLDAHPQEFLFVIMRHEDDSESTSHKTEWPVQMGKYLAAKKHYIIDYTPTLTVRDLRGKLLVMSRNTYEGGPVGGYLNGGGDNSTYDRTLSGMSGAYMNMTTQDMYDVAASGQLAQKVTAIKSLLSRSLSEKEYRLYMNHASGYSMKTSIFGTSFPSYEGVEECARTCNKAFIDYMQGKKGPMGFVMMDFAGDYKYYGQELIDVIINNCFKTYSSERDEDNRIVKDKKVYIAPLGRDRLWVGSCLFKDDPKNTSSTLDALPAPATTWKSIDFTPTSDWVSKEMPMGSSSYLSPYRTTWEGEYNTYWIRREFTLDEVNEATAYYLEVYHENKYEIYVNGILVDKTDNSTYNKEFTTIKEIQNTILITGKNVIAIHVQKNEGEAYFDCGIFVEPEKQYYENNVLIGGFYYNFHDNDAEVTSNGPNAYSGIIFIPDNVTYDGKTYRVTSIADNAFSGCSGLTSIIIPNSMISIGDDAFSGCTGLLSVTINSRAIASATYTSDKNLGTIFGKQVKEYILGVDANEIGAYAFSGCSGLTSITIPYKVTSIGGSAFKNCSGLTSITIPYKVTSIGGSAFLGCSGLTSITIPNGVTSIGDNTFSGCSGLTSITIPDRVTKIGAYAFSDCSGLTSITIPNSVTSIGYRAFDGCTGLLFVTLNSNAIVSATYSAGSDLGTIFGSQVKEYILGDEITSIGAYAFSFCYALTSIAIPESVTSIAGSAFSGCTGLLSVTLNSNAIVSAKYTSNKNLGTIFGSQVKEYILGDETTEIGDYAFSACSGITSITIPNSVTTIGENTFQYCRGLTSITIPNSVTSIGGSAFFGCSGLTSITIPKSLISIGDGAFSGCTGLLSVTLNSKVFASVTSTFGKDLEKMFGSQVKEYILSDETTIIDDYAFSACSGITSITIPNSVTTIGKNAFQYCRGLTSITIPNSVTSIGKSAFQDCDGLISATVSESVTEIDDYVFVRCSGLTSVIIPNSVTRIGDGVFTGCSGLSSIIIPESVTEIGNYVFSGCTGLLSVTLNSNVITSATYTSKKNLGTMFGKQVKEYILGDETTSIGDYAFYGCSGLASIIIPNSVTSIGQSAFSGCSGLPTITIPDSVTSIGQSAFSDCSSLTSITISESVTSISVSAFEGCINLDSVTIPNNVTTIGGSAFSGCRALASISIPESVTTIGGSAFSGCRALVSISIPESVTTIGAYAFYGCDSINYYVNRGSMAMFYVWSEEKDPYEMESSQKLLRPSISLISTSQTTIKYKINNIYPGFEYNSNYSEVVGNDEYLIKGLRPEIIQPVYLTVSSGNNSYSTSTDVMTSSISPCVNGDSITASSIFAKGSYIEGDAKVVSQSFVVNGIEIEGGDIHIYGLDPNSSYCFEFIIIVEDSLGDKYKYENSQEIITNDIIFVSKQPRVVSSGNVIVSASSNLDFEETNVGFEWRRTDWPDDFASNTGTAYLYGGNMEGNIRNLNPDKLWRSRPYYESNTGKRYYGEWVGIDPTNTSYFEPTVYTYSTYNVFNNKVEVKGYAMRGSDNISKQGFMYWKGSSNANSIPANAKMVEAKGNIMVATIEELDYDTEYYYVAFVTTSENETFYGEEQTFKTGAPSQEVIDGIMLNEEFRANNKESASAVYDMSGRKLSAPQKGLNIIRMKDGTTRKVMIK